jgi:hypothetical protein
MLDVIPRVPVLMKAFLISVKPSKLHQVADQVEVVGRMQPTDLVIIPSLLEQTWTSGPMALIVRVEHGV